MEHSCLLLLLQLSHLLLTKQLNLRNLHTESFASLTACKNPWKPPFSSIENSLDDYYYYDSQRNHSRNQFDQTRFSFGAARIYSNLMKSFRFDSVSTFLATASSIPSTFSESLNDSKAILLRCCLKSHP